MNRQRSNYTVVGVLLGGGEFRHDVRNEIGQTVESFHGKLGYEEARAFVLRLSIRILPSTSGSGRAA